MTTDPFTTAARAEAERVHFPIPAHRTPSVVARASAAAFRDGASWARTYLAAHDARVRRDAWDACYHQMVTAPARGVTVTKKGNPYAPERRETP